VNSCRNEKIEQADLDTLNLYDEDINLPRLHAQIKMLPMLEGTNTVTSVDGVREK